MVDKEQCVGCSACENICPKNCISMKQDEEGFLYPVIDKEQCINCGLCGRVCFVGKIIDIRTDTKAYAAVNNHTIRQVSSSGGIFTLLAEYVFEKQGIVFGAIYDEEFRVIHSCADNEVGLVQMRNAKYSQSDLGNTFIKVKEYLEEGRWVLFSGTPCQIVGLKTYLNKDYEKLVCVDLICHGVPSPKVWSKYIEFRAENRNVISINMRSKKSGWTNYSYSTEFVYEDGKKEYILNSKDVFMQAFVNDFCLRPSCYDCPCKGLERVSDFTLGDFWGIWNIMPEMDDNKGTSLVFVHTKKAQKIWNIILPFMSIYLVDKELSVKNNQSMIASSCRPEKRDYYMKNIDSYPMDQLLQDCLFGVPEKKTIFRRILDKLILKGD